MLQGHGSDFGWLCCWHFRMGGCVLFSKGLHAGRCSWGKANSYNVGYSFCSTTWCRVVLQSAKEPTPWGGWEVNRAPPLKSTRQKGKVEAHPMNIHRHIQSAIVKCELCHNIEKGHPNPNMFTLDMSGHIHIVDFWQLWLFKWTAQSRRIKSIKRMDGRPKWMTDLALNLSKHVRTREA